MIRGGHLDLCVLGAFQVAANGDLANWSTGAPDAIPGVGGAMDLAVGAKAVYPMTDHCTRRGEPKIVERVAYPLTGAGVVNRIYTDLAVIDVTPAGLVVGEMVAGLDFAELQQRTGAPSRRPTRCAPWRRRRCEGARRGLRLRRGGPPARASGGGGDRSRKPRRLVPGRRARHARSALRRHGDLHDPARAGRRDGLRDQPRAGRGLGREHPRSRLRPAERTGRKIAVHYGGPVGPTEGFILHSATTRPATRSG